MRQQAAKRGPGRRRQNVLEPIGIVAVFDFDRIDRATMFAALGFALGAAAGDDLRSPRI